MLGRKGQAFDAFKLLIAAVVAGSILVIILSMLGGFVTPGGDPVTVMAQAVQSVRGAPGSGTVSTQVVQFQKDQYITTAAVESKAGVNPGSVGFCGVTSDCSGEPRCGPGGVYEFSEDLFTIGDNSISANQKVGGKIWVYHLSEDEQSDADVVYCIGFKISE